MTIEFEIPLLISSFPTPFHLQDQALINRMKNCKECEVKTRQKFVENFVREICFRDCPFFLTWKLSDELSENASKLWFPYSNCLVLTSQTFLFRHHPLHSIHRFLVFSRLRLILHLPYRSRRILNCLKYYLQEPL